MGLIITDPKSAVAVFLNRHVAAESSLADAITSFPIVDSVGTLNAGHIYDNIQDDSKILRDLLDTLFKKCDFGLRKLIFKDIARALLNFYNKIIIRALPSLTSFVAYFPVFVFMCDIFVLCILYLSPLA